MAHVSVSAHGTSFHVQNLSSVDRTTRFGWGLEVVVASQPPLPPFSTYGPQPSPPTGPVTWVHAPIPIAAAWDVLPVIVRDEIVRVEAEETVQVTQVSIEFDAPGDLHVSDLHVWNGGSRIANLDSLNEYGPSLTHVFDPWHAVDGLKGLSLSIGVDVEWVDLLNPRGTPPPWTLTFHSAHAFFTIGPTDS